MSNVVCNVCGKASTYDKYQHKDPTRFVCVGCRNEAVETKETSNGFFCISENANGDKLQACWLCTDQKATHFVEFNFIYKRNEYAESEKDKYFFYCCEKCYATYRKLEGKTFDVTNEKDFLSYDPSTQLRYFLQKKEMK